MSAAATHRTRPDLVDLVPSDTGTVERRYRTEPQLGISALTPTLLMHTPTSLPSRPLGYC